MVIIHIGSLRDYRGSEAFAKSCWVSFDLIQASILQNAQLFN